MWDKGAPRYWKRRSAEADFNEDKIAGLLTGMGYKETGYEDYSYFGIRGDYKIDQESEFSRLTLYDFNRMAVLDNRTIIAPSTAFITGIFDAMSGKVPSVTDNPAARTVANDLNNVLCGVIVPPEDLFSAGLKYKFTIPSDWGLLH